MKVRFLHLNIFQGKYFTRIVKFIKENDIDLLHLQEVTGGKLSKGGGFSYEHVPEANEMIIAQDTVGIDNLKRLKEEFPYDFRFAKTSGFVGDPTAYYGNGTFFRPEFKLLDEKIIVLHPENEETPEFNKWEESGRSALFLKFEIENKTFWSINTHLAWGNNPYDADYKTKQAQLIIDEIEKLKEPFILSGDFNMVAETQVVAMFEKYGTNWTKKEGITNTLNGHVHGIKKLFPPGLAVDYVFTSPEVNVKSYRLVDEIDLSDHYGMLLELEV
ncbi:MAG TPA: endonuclease/exonuclease/phosphatase family protein [Patescibacteria group bacterium]|nr:endonuclease/exonuclease/phosphatase family protein [Patescibacteria group bacterium]